MDVFDLDEADAIYVTLTNALESHNNGKLFASETMSALAKVLGRILILCPDPVAAYSALGEIISEYMTTPDPNDPTIIARRGDH